MTSDRTRRSCRRRWREGGRRKPPRFRARCQGCPRTHRGGPRIPRRRARGRLRLRGRATCRLRSMPRRTRLSRPRPTDRPEGGRASCDGAGAPPRNPQPHNPAPCDPWSRCRPAHPGVRGRTVRQFSSGAGSGFKPSLNFVALPFRPRFPRADPKASSTVEEWRALSTSRSSSFLRDGVLRGDPKENHRCWRGAGISSQSVRGSARPPSSERARPSKTGATRRSRHLGEESHTDRRHLRRDEPLGPVPGSHRAQGRGQRPFPFGRVPQGRGGLHQGAETC